ncbi:MAG: phosphotransferase system, HPr-related protein [Halonotius sp. J07HN4]|nr:MAG: phosphotransferase system, HPr-related protein [Halonotius sp. J07HN4]
MVKTYTANMLAMKRIVAVVPEAELRARPISKSVKAATQFDGESAVGRADGGESMSANNMFAVSGLNVDHSEEVRLTADGADADASLNNFEALLTMPVEEKGDNG